nr:CYTH and CHAD domain-containing protein [uncultured Friedmanniella sp.]
MATPSEIEPATFDIADDVLLPALADLAGPKGEVEVRQHTFTDSYLDTAGGDLAAAGASLSRRAGSLGVSWLLRLPPGTTPAQLVSRATTRAVPAALAAATRGLTRGAELRPVAELSTQRTVSRLVGPDGRLRAEVADDRVSSTTLGDVSRLDHWRMLTLRPGESDQADAEPVAARLREVGAGPAERPGALERALGVPPQPASPPANTLGDLVGRYVTKQCDQIARGDLALRLGQPSVHSTRVAIRRLRSTLRVFAELLDPEPSQRLEQELVWWAGLLGEVRDREVLAARFASQLASLPPELVLGPVAADVDATLSRERAEHLRRLREEVTGPRVLGLLEALARWRAEPPLLEGASAPAEGVKAYVKAADRKARRRLRRAARVEPGHAQEEQLHRSRKAAKRARYAAELAQPVWPGAAARVTRGKQVQEVLGEHQDSVVAMAFLLRAGAVAGTRRGRNGFTYGLLLEAERRRTTQVWRQLKKINH